MTRPIDTIAQELARACDALDRAEAALTLAEQNSAEAASAALRARQHRDRLRLELRAAVREAGDRWPDPARDA